MSSSSSDIVYTLIIEILDIFNERLGTYWKFRLKLRGGEGGTYLQGGASSISRERRFLIYLRSRIRSST